MDFIKCGKSDTNHILLLEFNGSTLSTISSGKKCFSHNLSVDFIFQLSLEILFSHIFSMSCEVVPMRISQTLLFFNKLPNYLFTFAKDFHVDDHQGIPFRSLLT